jgi:hypothetical protein
MSKSWTQLALLELDVKLTTDVHVAYNRMRRTIQALHDYSCSVWLARIEALYYTENAEVQVRRLSQLRLDIFTRIESYFVLKISTCFVFCSNT